MSSVSRPRPGGNARETRRYPQRDLSEGRRFELGSVRSRNPVERTRCQFRFDPYWDGLWTAGATAFWMTRDLAERQLEAGLLSVPSSFLEFTAEEAVDGLLAPSRRGVLLKVLGLLSMWRTMSVQQLTALSGEDGIWSAGAKMLRLLFAAGLVDVGAFASPLRQVPTGDVSTWLVRLNRDGRVFNRAIAPHLTWPEWVSVTGGMRWDASGQYDRHNTLTTELGLRAAEFLDVGAVLGERFTGMDLLTHGVVSRDRLPAPRRGDLLVVRPDGVRVVFEVTATRSAALQEKADRWAQTLEASPWESSGLMVVFVSATAPEAVAEGTDEARSGIYQVVARATRTHPGSVSDRTALRMGAISWQDWFPARHEASVYFEGLEVDFPSGPDEDLWQARSVLDSGQVPFDPVSRGDATAVLDNVAMLASVPHWQRPAATNELWPLTFSGEFGSIPSPAPDREGRSKNHPLGAARGGVPAAKPPRRLLVNPT